MYSSFPKRDRIAIRVALGTAWGFSSLAGIGGMFFTPSTVQNELGLHLPLFSSLIVFIFSVVAFFGVIFNKYQLEWFASWFVSGSSAVYVITVWALVFTGVDTRFQQASSLSALLCFYVYRIIACSAHARKQRVIHQIVQSGQVTIPDAK